MLVSHKYKFIYTKTLKTAGTSIESYFERFCMHDGEFQQLHYREEYESEVGIVGRRRLGSKESKWWNHMPAKNIKENLGDEIWNSYFKFCSIRNPYEKCISYFEHLGKKKKISLTENLKAFLRYPTYTNEQRQFLIILKRGRMVDRNKYLIDGEFCLDDYIRFENLNSDIERICKILSIPFEPEYIPTFKSEFRRPKATVDKLYTQKSIDLVRTMFAYEFEKFGYKT
ncbi:MAG: sulfotransferase family protein [Melioribacteraceae bacterium]|nr:sulfotransferase family protein [Melioribacteraceae bacterium]MCF8263079.1 sulfotransferase family protein [Melioribacteraceae bacterium]MCF8431227.1 sulfotransferase family protein [Melioribacteraceae bacterium]